jgi:hypothetical protein
LKLSLWLRALLISVALCGVAMLLGLVQGLGQVLWIFWLPGMAAVAYPWGALQGGFDAEMHPRFALLVVLADLLFWWLAIYVLLRLWRSCRSRLQANEMNPRG